MAATITKDHVKREFSKVGLDHVNKDILSKCAALSSTLQISPSQMAESWEAYSLNKNVTELTDHTFSSFRTILVKDADTSALPEKTGGAVMVTPVHKRKTTIQTTTTVQSKAPRVSLSPGKKPSGIVTPNQLSQATPKYNERKNVGKVMTEFNPKNLPEVNNKNTNYRRCVVSCKDFDTNVQESYRHMFTTLDERSKALDDYLYNMGDVIIKRYDLGGASTDNESDHNENDIAPLEAVGVPHQDKICCIGRICNEAHSGRINTTSVVLEGSRYNSGGARINLDLSQMSTGEQKQSFSLFPGQIIGVEGINTSGRKMVAYRICEGAAPEEKSKTSASMLMKYHHDKQEGQPVKLMSVCGPYTTSDNLDYEPLHDLLNVVRTDKPDVVILSGPFVDTRHPLVKDGNVHLENEDGTKIYVSYETFFANKVAASLEDLYAEIAESGEELCTQFVIVPSLDDAISNDWVYPQAPYSDRLPSAKNVNLPNAEGIEFGTLGIHHVESAGGREVSISTKKNDTGSIDRRIHLVSNPCTLKVNETIIGVTSTDVLFHINADETNANLEPGSRLQRISQHLLQQRSYYPLFPPPASNMSTAPNLDLKHMKQWSMPCQPDVLIVPSKLACFAKTVLDSTVVINPGHLSRGTTGGTYGIMDIHPMKRETLENSVDDEIEIEHGIQDRIRVEIKRI